MWFVTYRTLTHTDEQAKRFNTVEQLFLWLQEYVGANDRLPDRLCVYKAECLFDHS